MGTKLFMGGKPNPWKAKLPKWLMQKMTPKSQTLVTKCIGSWRKRWPILTSRKWSEVLRNKRSKRRFWLLFLRCQMAKLMKATMKNLQTWDRPMLMLRVLRKLNRKKESSRSLRLRRKKRRISKTARIRKNKEKTERKKPKKRHPKEKEDQEDNKIIFYFIKKSETSNSSSTVT